MFTVTLKSISWKTESLQELNKQQSCYLNIDSKHYKTYAVSQAEE